MVYRLDRSSTRLGLDMALAPYGPQKSSLVSRCDRAGIVVNGTLYAMSVAIFSFSLPVPWPVHCALTAQATDFYPLCNECDIVLFGTGHILPSTTFRELRTLFFTKRVGFEIMNTAAACRTFNLIAEEGRRAGAFLIIEP